MSNLLRLFLYFADGPPRNLTAASNYSTTVYITWMPPLKNLLNVVDGSESEV